MSDLDTAKKDISKLLSVLNINKVVYVDDDIPEVSIEEVIISDKRNVIIEKYFHEIKSNLEEVENERLREIWKDTTYDVLKEIRQILLSAPQNISDTDEKAIPAFMELMPTGFIDAMSPVRWDHEKSELLANKETTLFLFDQDLRKRVEKDDGILIIKEISKTNNVLCGLFTQLEQADDYFGYRDKLSEVYSVEKDKFFVIPKKEAIDNHSLFVYLLKLTILGRDFFAFKDCICKMVNDISISAKKEIDKIWIEDFDQIIFKVPQMEGSWEPDMFFRIYNGFQRRIFNQNAYSNGELQNSIAKIRTISSISTKPSSSLIPPKAWRIQHDELYEKAEHLNNNHLPIEVGDIFEKTNKDSINRYILLTQPCDLMVRSDGTRARADNRFILLKMRRMAEKGYELKNYEKIVEYYGASQDEKWIFNFKDISLVKDYILDLCVYHDDGISKYLSALKFDESFIRPSLICRYPKITDQISEEIKASKKIFDQITEKPENILSIKKDTYEVIFKDDLFKAKYEHNEDGFTLTFNCKRTGRLLYERAVGLLAEFYSVMQRPAYPPDLDEGL
jgi:hypothetical protein